jgi:hypothetical protein
VETGILLKISSSEWIFGRYSLSSRRLAVSIFVPQQEHAHIATAAMAKENEKGLDKTQETR